MPRFTTMRLVFINAMVCGLDVAATVAFTYLPPILLKAGFAESNMGIILGIGPFVGMFTVSAVGQLSDYWNERYGQRMYFILLFAVIVSSSLVFIIIGHRLTMTSDQIVLGSILLAVGGIALDYSSQVALNPCESLLSDLLQDSDCLEKGFSIYSGLLSLGGCIGYLVTAIHWPWGQQEEAACGAALLWFLLCCFATILAVSTVSTSSNNKINKTSKFRSVNNTLYKTYDLKYRNLPKIILKKICSLFKIIYQYLLLLPCSVLKEVWYSPLVLWKLFITDTISWAASTSYNLFFAHYMGQVVFGGHPNAPHGSLEEDLYNEGVRMGSWGLLLHSVAACGYVLLLQHQLIRYWGFKRTYLFGLLSFSICMFATLLFKDVWILNTLSALSGVGFAVMTSIPSALVTIYRSNQNVYYYDITEEQRRGSGADFGILYVGYYLGQTVLSLVMSNIVQIVGLAHCYIAFASIAGFLACYYANQMIYNLNDLTTLKNNNNKFGYELIKV